VEPAGGAVFCVHHVVAQASAPLPWGLCVTYIVPPPWRGRIQVGGTAAPVFTPTPILPRQGGGEAWLTETKNLPHLPVERGLDDGRTSGVYMARSTKAVYKPMETAENLKRPLG
jgi:hypothetical protein